METCGSSSSQERRQLRRQAIEVGGETLPLVQALIEVRYDRSMRCLVLGENAAE